MAWSALFRAVRDGFRPGSGKAFARRTNLSNYCGLTPNLPDLAASAVVSKYPLSPGLPDLEPQLKEQTSAEAQMGRSTMSIPVFLHCEFRVAGIIKAGFLGTGKRFTLSLHKQVAFIRKIATPFSNLFPRSNEQR